MGSKVKVYSTDSWAVGHASLNVVTNKIVSIELLQGGKELADTEIVQYVNLKRDLQYVDGAEVKHIDRLGRSLKLKVTFENEANIKFKVELRPDPGNVRYSSNEKSLNPNFEFTASKEFCKANLPNSANSVERPPAKNTVAYVGLDKTYKPTNDILVSPAGGDVFSIVATDQHGNEVTAKSKVRTCRIMYYVEAKMRGLASITPDLNTLVSEYEKYGIKLKKLSPFEINHLPNIDKTDDAAFKSSVLAGYSSSAGKFKEPHSVVIAYTDQLAVQGQGELRYLGAESTNTNIKISVYDTLKMENRYLWKDLDERGWFVECFYVEEGKPLSSKVAIPQSKCTASRSLASYTGKGRYDQVKIDVTGLPAGKKCRIYLKVNWVNRFRGGFSNADNNIVTVCTRANWATVPYSDQQGVAIHEIGHQLGMVPDGSNKSHLDKTTLQYSHTHLGSHCNRPKGCVMYGVVNGVSAFCSDCADSVRKVDLSNGIK
jgi:type VI secretion system secreted protein VgrG